MYDEAFPDQCKEHPFVGCSVFSSYRAHSRVERFSNRVGQNCIYTAYMTVYSVISLPKIPHIHHIYIVLANPKVAFLYSIPPTCSPPLCQPTPPPCWPQSAPPGSLLLDLPFDFLWCPWSWWCWYWCCRSSCCWLCWCRCWCTSWCWSSVCCSYKCCCCCCCCCCLSNMSWKSCCCDCCCCWQVLVLAIASECIKGRKPMLYRESSFIRLMMLNLYLGSTC